MSQSKIRNYSELIQLPTFLERFNYLKLGGVVGKDTFGWDRYMNQRFYRSQEWQRIRDWVIIRDNGCDLGIPGREIASRLYIHHMNPIGKKDLLEESEYLMNPEYLICVSYDTHNAIHYGDETLLMLDPVVRQPGDTKLW